MDNIFQTLGLSEDVPSAANAEQVPSWLLAADNHNLGNSSGGSWLDPETWSTKFENAGKTIATGILSGANSFYNSGVVLGNWLGNEVEQRDTQAWISEIDSDLGAYYAKNRQSSDLLGFIAGSLIPGLAGVKVLNAGQKALNLATKTGLIGTNLSKATGLLVPNTERYITLAAQDITQSAATFSSINSNGIKALASGVWQNTLEGVAFETFVQASMFKSPILEGQDNWDIIKNIAIGGAVGGVIGGALSGASSFGKIRNIVSKEEAALKPFTSRATIQEGATPFEKLILMAEDKDFGALPLPGSENFAAAQKLYTDRLRRINDDMRSTIHEIVKGEDSELGNMLADVSLPLNHQNILNNYLYVREATRIGRTTAIESEINAAIKENLLPPPELQISYVKLLGEGVGEVSDEAPVVINLADKVSVSANNNTKDLVLRAVKDYGFKPEQNWNIKSLKGTSAHYEAEARQIWADVVLKEIKPGTAINQYDIPVLERALKDGVTDIKLVDDAGGILVNRFNSVADLRDHIITAKQEAANLLLQSLVLEGSIPIEQGTRAIAKMVNTKLARLEGTNVGADSSDFFAWQSANREYAESLAKNKLVPANAEGDTRFLPSYAKIAKRVENVEDLDGHVIDGMAWIKAKQRALREGVNNVVAKASGDLYSQMVDIPDSLLLNADRYGAGAGIASFANGTYGSLESVMQMYGSVTKRLGQKYRADTAGVLESSLSSLGQKQEAVIEAATIDQKVTRSGKLWVRHTDDSGDYLIERGALTETKTLEDLSNDQIIELANPEVINYIDNRMARTGFRTQTYRELRAAQGHTDVRDPDVYRPIRPSPTDYPFFAFVKDPRVTGSGHTTMIFANSEQKLKDLIDKVPKEYNVITKGQAEAFYAARNEYEFQRTLHESYIDSTLKNRGIQSEFFTITDPQKFVDRVLQQELREDDILAKELIRAKNQAAFDWLEDQGKQYSELESSRFGGSVARVEKAGKNPYIDYIKTALDISKVSEHPLIYGFNKFLDEGVSKIVGAVRDLRLTEASDEQINAINGMLEKYGMNTGWRDAATDLLVNHTAPRGELTKFIRGANAVLAKLTLGLDPLNALNNAIGANILRGTELKQITDAIKSGDTLLAGRLGELAKIKLPGTGDQIISPGKLVASSIKRYFDDFASGKLLKEYQDAGFVQDITTQFKSILDDFTLKGTESASILGSRLKQAIQKANALSETGQKFTGNKLAEEFNRFISADVMRQITDLGVEQGLLTKSEQFAYINTFVNRVEGNVIASQRPLMFQGPIGQAIGLFQSYQFNLMQQLFRYVAEGSKKDAAMLLGLQGTFYGLQGLPAFQFINQHVVGTLSGNQKHIDLYDSTYGLAGKDVGNFLLYGLPSNILNANLYARGDINPRQVTVIPTTFAEIPIVGAYGRLFSSLKETFTKSAGGAPVWESMLQGLEHNGLSRPLAGLAQTLQAFGTGGQAYSTTSKGSILFSNDLASWATAVRLAGGRPLDEAIVNDGIFRIHAYQQYDLAKKQKLAETVKASVIQGNIPSHESIIQFSEAYAAAGGKPAQFNRFMMEGIKNANTNEATKIVNQLQNPFAQKMQLLMGYSGE